MSSAGEKAKTQAGASPITGVVPPKERRFGQPNGNKRGRGFWKKEDTPRYKLEQMMKLTESELIDVAKDKDAPYFERKLAVAINQGDWNVIEHMINQVYGTPKQIVEQTNIEAKPLLDLTKRKKRKNGNHNGAEED